MRLDREFLKPFDRTSGVNYTYSHSRALHLFIQRFREEDQSQVIIDFMQQEPALLASILRNNYEMSENQRIDRVIKALTEEGTFTFVLGLPRNGKTALVVWLIEELHRRNSKFKIYWFGYSAAIKKAYPFVIQTFDLKSVSGIDENGNNVGGLLVYDEMLLSLLGRDAMSKEVKERITEFPTAGHSSYAVVGLSQSTRIDPIYKDLLTYILFKPFVISSMFEKNMMFKKCIKYLIPTSKVENLLYNITSNEAFMFNNPLPRKWNSEISKAYAPITDEKQAIEYARSLIEAGFDQRDVRKFCRQRNVNIDLIAEKVYKEIDATHCDKCGSHEYQGWGHTIKGIQKYRCSQCGHVYTDKKDIG